MSGEQPHAELQDARELLRIAIRIHRTVIQRDRLHVHGLDETSEQALIEELDKLGARAGRMMARCRGNMVAAKEGCE